MLPLKVTWQKSPKNLGKKRCILGGRGIFWGGVIRPCSACEGLARVWEKVECRADAVGNRWCYYYFIIPNCLTEFHSLAYIFPHRITPAQKIPHMLRSLGSQNNSGNFNAFSGTGPRPAGSECEHSFMEYKVSTTSFLIIEKCGHVPHFFLVQLLAF